jgi:hypothetical protein
MTKPRGEEGGGEPLDYRAIAGSAAFAALDPKLKLLFEYWDAKRGTQPLPARLGLPVAELKPWIGQLVLSARVPVIARPRVHVGEKSEIYSELLLPLSDGGESVTTILLGAYLSRDA